MTHPSSHRRGPGRATRPHPRPGDHSPSPATCAPGCGRLWCGGMPDSRWWPGRRSWPF